MRISNFITDICTSTDQLLISVHGRQWESEIDVLLVITRRISPELMHIVYQRSDVPVCLPTINITCHVDARDIKDGITYSQQQLERERATYNCVSRCTDKEPSFNCTKPQSPNTEPRSWNSDTVHIACSASQFTKLTFSVALAHMDPDTVEASCSEYLNFHMSAYGFMFRLVMLLSVKAISTTQLYTLLLARITSAGTAGDGLAILTIAWQSCFPQYL